MEWIDGEPLYAWAEKKPPTSHQVLKLLRQLARALEALHAVGGVHRDVKGENILVRREDGRAVLTDFGSGVPQGARTLTPPGAFIGTPAYRSAESWLSELRSPRPPDAHHRAGPADDVFALGVTACRLLTGEYPELGEPTQDSSGTWHLEALVLPSALQQVEEPLRSLVLRMLSVRPEQRGTAAQLAQALEGVSRASPPVRRRAWLAVAAVAVCLSLGGMWTAPRLAEQVPQLACADSSSVTAPDTGTQGLGKAATTAQGPAAQSAQPQALAEEALPELRPGQTRADSKGRCPHKKQIVLNGGCWGLMEADEGTCAGFGGYLFKKACYVPFIPKPQTRPPTSHPAREP
jgi:hypothetical protein